jgi:hypothetical protein
MQETEKQRLIEKIEAEATAAVDDSSTSPATPQPAKSWKREELVEMIAQIIAQWVVHVQYLRHTSTSIELLHGTEAAKQVITALSDAGVIKLEE